ncbi:MAG: SpoIIE family protein phosphatase [Lachnospiraceae bacterium]|nr:SpoIIE family protein phosphatase [Lachnospiraceae bacterium]
MLTAVKKAGRLLYGRQNEHNQGEAVRIPELCRQKLLRYAESFEELARCMDANEGEDDKYGREERQIVEAWDVGETDRRDAIEERRIAESRLMIRHNLYEMSQIMVQLADELIQCRPLEKRYQKVIRHALRAESIFAEQLCYLTDREDTRAICMTLYTDRNSICPAEGVADLLSALLGRKLQLSATSPVRVEEEPHSFIFVEEPRFTVLTGFCKVKKEGEELSGDHYSVLESEKGRITLLLSDGTGSGEEASRDSEKALDLMEKFLEAGYETGAAADMVNAAFYLGEKDLAHPTLDLCDLDLYDGSCRFIKVGGAASFFRHGKRVEQIRQGALPLGIFRSPEWEEVSLQLADGDHVIMMTDGVLDALPQENYGEIMEQFIEELAQIGPGEIAEKIMEFTLHACGGHVEDDMTVLVAGIWENT